MRNEPILAFPPEVFHPTVDRPQEMKKVQEAFEKQKSKEVAVVYLAGEPGVGKSQLARNYAVDYYSTYSTMSKTLLTLDMNDFRVNYSKLAIKLGVGVADGQNLGTIAEEMKKILSKRKYWLLIINNYNSTEYEGFERGTVTII